MKYLITGTTVHNETEVIKSLESLWDAADAKDEPFELVLRENWPKNETSDAIRAWIASNEEALDGPFHVDVPAEDVLPQVDAVLVLCGEEPDHNTNWQVQHWYDVGVDVFDLASNLVKLEFDDEQPLEEPPATGAAANLGTNAGSGLGGGWPGEDAVVPAAEPEPEKSREVAPAAQEAVQSDPEPSEAAQESAAEVLDGVSESDLEHMGKPALKALVDRLGLEADRRSPGAMIAALMEVIIDLDKAKREPAEAKVAEMRAESDKVKAEAKAVIESRAAEVGGLDVATASVEEIGQYAEKRLAELAVDTLSDKTVIATFTEIHYSDGTVTKLLL